MKMMSPEFVNNFNTVIKTLAFASYKKVPRFRDRFFDVQGSTRPDETLSQLGEFSVPAKIVEGQTIPMDRIYPQFDKVITHFKVGKGFEVTKELLDDDQFRRIPQLPSRLGEGFAVLAEQDAAQFFNESNNTTVFTCADGQAICSDSHASNSPDGVTQSNIRTGANATFNSANLIAAINQAAGWYDDRGNLLAQMMDTLLVGQDLWADAKVLMETEGKPGTPDNDKNVLQGYFKVVVWPRLTGTGRWFLMNSSFMKGEFGAVWYNREKLSISNSMNQNNEVYKWTGTERRSHGIHSWQGILGAFPS